MKALRYLGISFLGKKIQFAEIEHGRKVSVTQLAECETVLDFSDSDVLLSGGLVSTGKLVTAIRDTIRKVKFEAEYISFAVPTNSVFINIIPLDSSLVGANLTNYLQWEMEQYFPGINPKDFVLDHHSLPSHNGGAHQAFVVGVPRQLAVFFHKVAVDLRLKMSIIDIDQFSTEKTLIVNYPEILEHDIALIGLRGNIIDASLIHNGEMTDYRSFHLTDGALPTKFILEYLRYIKSRENNSPAALLLHGTDISQNYVLLLRNETNIKQTIALNALRKLKISGTLSPILAKENFRFAAAIGLALRTQ